MVRVRPLSSRSTSNEINRKFSLSAKALLTHFFVGFMTFHIGFIVGSANGITHSQADCVKQSQATNRKVSTETGERSRQLIPDSVKGFMVGTATVPRADFIKQFDIGVPWDDQKPEASDVVILYQSLDSLPFDYLDSGNQQFTSSLNATKNCNSLKVILTKPNVKNSCLAVVGQWDSFHLHHFLRLKSEQNHDVKAPTFQSDYPLRYVSRRHELSGKKPQLPPDSQTTKYWPILVDYLQKLPATLARLQPLAEQVAGNDNTIVVMVCNYGQSELLQNFICSARARQLSLDRVLLFATDIETYNLAQSLGITTFQVQDAFGEMPTNAAGRYGDKQFTGMMLSKVYCVHLINELGYDLLFQDVDVVWYRDPLKYFRSEESGVFDLYFQDDGAHSNRYAPYSPNSGFYFVRQNERTRYFFDVFLRMGDLILASGSHQSALNDLLTDHSSSKGLRVKVFQRDSELGQLFPGGFHYHKRYNYMKEVIEGKKSPYIFHMSWTLNKLNKSLFYQQMGDWFVKDECINKKVEHIGDGSGKNVIAECCLANPQIQCHFRDKPSKIPCKDSPPIDKGHKSFW